LDRTPTLENQIVQTFIQGFGVHLWTSNNVYYDVM
jgi:hypothetical protein